MNTRTLLVLGAVAAAAFYFLVIRRRPGAAAANGGYLFAANRGFSGALSPTDQPPGRGPSATDYAKGLVAAGCGLAAASQGGPMAGAVAAPLCGVVADYGVRGAVAGGKAVATGAKLTAATVYQGGKAVGTGAVAVGRTTAAVASKLKFW